MKVYQYKVILNVEAENDAQGQQIVYNSISGLEHEGIMKCFILESSEIEENNYEIQN